MASRKSRAAQRKRNARIRSQQVSKNIQSISGTAYNPSKITPNIIRHMSDKQLRDYATNVASGFAEVKEIAKQYEKSREFFVTPPLKITKKELALSRQVPPSLQDVAGKTGKRAQLARKKRREILAAREKIAYVHDAIDENGLGQSIEQYRQSEQNGASAQSLRKSSKAGTTDLARLRNFENVLADENVVNNMSIKDLRRELIRRSGDIKAVNKNGLSSNLPRISDKDNDYVLQRIRAGFGDAVAKQWQSLSKHERYSLLNQTKILNDINYFSTYDKEQHKYVSWNPGGDNTGTIRNNVTEFLKNAHNIADSMI